MNEIDLWGYVESAQNIDNPEMLFLHFRNTLNDFGVDQVVYSLLTEHQSIDKAAKHAMFSGYKNDWMDHYVKNNYEDIDPVIKYMKFKDGFFLWENLEREYRSLSSQEAKLMNEANEAGLKSGAGISIFNNRHEICGMGFANTDGALDWENPIQHSVIQMIANHFHAAYLELMKIPTSKRIYIRLAPREEEIIKWLAYGKSIPEISDILGISVNTIKTNIRNACVKLDCFGTRALVAKSIYFGLIRINF